MTWTTPKTWNVGDLMTSVDLNTYVRDNSNALRQPSLYRAEYYRNGAFTVNTGDTLINFDTQVYDASSNFSVSTGLWTCAVAGVYEVDTTVQVSPNALTVLRLYKNGAPYHQITQTTAGVGVGFSTSVLCNAGDTLGIYCRANVASSAGVTGPLATNAAFRLESGN